VMEKSKA